jgi:hypothetical protein
LDIVRLLYHCRNVSADHVVELLNVDDVNELPRCFQRAATSEQSDIGRAWRAVQLGSPRPDVPK